MVWWKEYGKYMKNLLESLFSIVGCVKERNLVEAMKNVIVISIIKYLYIHGVYVY